MLELGWGSRLVELYTYPTPKDACTENDNRTVAVILGLLPR